MSDPSRGFDAHDSAGVAANASALAAAGYGFAVQYIDQNPATEDGPPGVTPAQAAAERAAGLDLVSVYETAGLSSTDYRTGAATFGWQSYLTEAQGRADAAEAVASARALGQPAGSAIYFAMDFDPAATSGIGEAEALSRVQSYFRGVGAVMAAEPAGSRYAVGVYGAGDMLNAVVREAGLAQYGWLSLSTGWAGSGAGQPNAQGWSLYQSGGATAAGVEIDPDAARGAFGPWSAGTATGGGATTGGAAASAPTLDSGVGYDGAGAFTLTGTAPGAAAVSFTAVVGGQAVDLGTAQVGPDGSFTFVDHVGAAAQSAVTATTAGGSAAAPFDLVGDLAGRHFAGQQVSLDPGTGAPASRTLFRADGTVGAVAALAPGQTLEAPAGGNVLAGGQGDGTFVFAPGFGRDVVQGFTASGPDHDTLALPASDFTGIADVLNRARDAAGGAVLRDPVTHDALLVVGVSAAELRRNPSDIALV